MNLSKINNDYYTHIEDVISLHLKGIGFQFLLEKYRNEPLGVSKYIQMITGINENLFSMGYFTHDLFTIYGEILSGYDYLKNIINNKVQPISIGIIKKIYSKSLKMKGSQNER